MMKQLDFKTNESERIGFDDTNNNVVDDDNSTLFTIVNKQKNEIIEGYNSEYPHIIFTLEGSFNITDKYSSTTVINAGQCIFLPKYETIDFHILEDVSVILLRFSYRTFMPRWRNMWDGCANKIEPCLHPVLEILPLLSPVLKNMIEAKSLFNSSNYQRIKAEEIHEIARLGYSDLQIAWFCQSVIRPKDDFRAFIEANFDKAKNCLEMASLVSMSETPFRKLFLKTFGESVHVWLMKQKAAKMKKIIEERQISNKELMIELNFCDKTSYIRFCRKWMGGNPTDMIKSIQLNNKLCKGK